MDYSPDQFAEKYQLALESAVRSNPESGLCGFEVEWNLLDSRFRPLLTVGFGPGQQSFVDYLRSQVLPPWLAEFSQLEIFHWMIEWATRPYFQPRGALYEARLMEAVLLNALSSAGRQFGEQLYAWHGNLPSLTPINHASIPGSWDIAKRRYLERCVDLYGETLATAGTHSNLSLPEPLLALDFMHLPASERGDTHLDDYKNGVYITATRLMRAFAALFIAVTASTPLQAVVRDGQVEVVLTGFDSVRNLTFPNPPALDLPDLYRSYQDYLHISYDLARRGVRFGNNNWTPVRARSFAEPVERLIAVTSDQLQEMYTRDLYAVGESRSVEQMARQIEIQNLLVRINLPMDRVEVRTGDGGSPLDVEVANLTLKHLLLLRMYADPSFARSFRYDREDLSRARRNEELAARHGLRGEIENPLTAKPVAMREFLRWTLEQVVPLAEALGLRADLQPLVEMAEGGPNTAERLRTRLRKELGQRDEVPLVVLRELAEERQAYVLRDVEQIAERMASLGTESAKLGEFLQRARAYSRQDPQAPVHFKPRPQALVAAVYPDKTSEVLDLARHLIRIPSVTACPEERLDEVQRAASVILDYLRDHGLAVRYFDGKYPALLAGFPQTGVLAPAPVMLSGHFDVVPPEPDDSQFEPRLEGDYLWGRGAADMKTVVATYMVWMKDVLRLGPPYPPVCLLLVGNEENGELEPMGTPQVFRLLAGEGWEMPSLFIAGERTEERGDGLWGEICTQNRGVMRFELVGRGQRGHSGVAGAAADLSERLLRARAAVTEIAARRLTLSSPDGWQSQVRFPFIQVGTPGIYNITPDYGVLGAEVRSIPQDDLGLLRADLQAYCQEQGFELHVPVQENGIACDPQNPYLLRLVEAQGALTGIAPTLGRKLPGTSARFAPGGQGVVWGQSGVGPHTSSERHYVPSILPYYNTLQAFAERLKSMPGKNIGQ